MHKHLLQKTLFALLAAMAFLALGCQETSSATAQEKLTKEEARSAISKLVPDVTVISLEPSPMEGIWEVVIESKGEKGILYLDAAKKYVVAGQVVEISSGTNLTKQKFEQINKVEFDKIPLDDAIVLGSLDAKYKAVVFDDPD